MESLTYSIRSLATRWENFYQLIAWKPFVLGEYFFKRGKDIRQQHGTKFLPGSGSYRKFGAPFDEGNLVTNADTLIASWRDKKMDSLVVRTRQRVEVILVLQFQKLPEVHQLMKNPRFLDKHGAGFSMIGAVERPDGPAKYYYELKTSKHGITISKTMDAAYPSIGYGLFEMELPSVEKLRMHGFPTASSYAVLFVEPGTRKSLAYPPTPADMGISKPIKAHSKCPKKLHDLWTATSGDVTDPDNHVDGDVTKSMMEHTTWHPLVVSILSSTAGAFFYHFSNKTRL